MFEIIYGTCVSEKRENRRLLSELIRIWALSKMLCGDVINAQNCQIDAEITVQPQ